MALVVCSTSFKNVARRPIARHSVGGARLRRSTPRTASIDLYCGLAAAIPRRSRKTDVATCAFSVTRHPKPRSHTFSARANTHETCKQLISVQQSWQRGSGQLLRRVRHRKHREQGLAPDRHRLSVSAAVSRLLATSPRIILRTLLRFLTRFIRPLMSGPATVIVLVVTIVGASFAAVRSRMAASTRSCGSCRGFGIQRCSLCRGAGAVGWEGKWNHQEICPSCLGKRFVGCPSCGGHFHRPTFAHARNKTRAEILASVDSGDVDADSSFLQRLIAD